MPTVRAVNLARAHPAAHLFGQPQQFAAHVGLLGQVDVEGAVGADRLLHLVGIDRPRVDARSRAPSGVPRRRPRPRGAACPAACSARSPTVRMPSRCSCSAVRAPTPHSAVTGSGCRKSSTRGHRDDEQPVRLAAGRRELGDELGGRDADRAGQLQLRGDPAADLRGDRPRPAEQPDRAGDVEERLVQRQRLDEGRDVAQDRHDLLGGLLVGRRGRAAARPHAGSGAAPRSSTSRCARRSGAPRTTPRRRRRGARRRRAPAGRAARAAS